MAEIVATADDTVAEPTDGAEGAVIRAAWHAAEYLYENVGVETTTESPAVEYLTENVGIEPLLSPHAVQYLHQNQLVEALINSTAEDDVAPTGDAAEASIWASRTGEDGVPEPGDNVGDAALLVRMGSEVVGGEDTVYAARTTFATATDTVQTPTDGAVGVVRHIFYRTGTEFLDRPVDSVEHLTHITDFRPTFEAPGRRLVRVRPNQVTTGPTATNWSSDVAVSKPRPYSAARPVLVDFGGFGFTTGGIAHNITEAEAEEQFMPVFSPEEVDHA